MITPRRNKRKEEEEINSLIATCWSLATKRVNARKKNFDPVMRLTERGDNRIIKDQSLLRGIYQSMWFHEEMNKAAMEIGLRKVF